MFQSLDNLEDDELDRSESTTYSSDEEKGNTLIMNHDYNNCTR